MFVDRYTERVTAFTSALNRIASALLMVGLVGSVVAIGSSGDATADSFTTGNVRGVVRDQATGQPAVSATVVATSASLQGEQVVIADEAGGYYLTAMPPGIYTLTVYYADGQFARSNVLVQVGKEAVVNITVNSDAGKGEVLRVFGDVPLIDQGSTKIGPSFNSNYTNNIPTASTFGGLIGAAGGAQADTYGVSFAGATSVENTYIVEGLNTTDTGFGLLSSNLPNEFVQETEVIAGGYNAEYGRATGAIVNVVTKSGSNAFHGSVFGRYQPSAFAAGAQPILREGTSIDRVTNQDYRADIGAELGGPIIKDKLWFHVGFTPTFTKNTTTRIVNTNLDMDDDGIADRDPATGFTRREEIARRDIPSSFSTYFFTSKLTGAVSANHQWQITGWGNPQTSEQLFATVRDPSTARFRNDQGAYDLSGKWTSKFNEGKTQVDIVLGYHNGYNRQSPLSEAEDVPGVVYEYTRSLYDFANVEGPGIEACNDNAGNDPYKKIVNCPVLNYTGQGIGFLENRTNNRSSALLAVTQRVKAAGQHIVKVGIDAEISTYDSGRRFTGGSFLQRNEGDDLSDPGMPVFGSFTVNQYLRYDTEGTIPCGLDTDGDGSGNATCSVIPSLDADTTDRSLAAYIQDSWQLRPNFTINAGLRWEQQIGYVAKFLQGTVAPDTGLEIPNIGFKLDNLLAPRVGFIYDPTQEGKAKIMGHWGRFYENIPMDLNVRQFGGETTRASVVGVDENGDANNSCPYDHNTPNLAQSVLGCQPGPTQALGGSISFFAPGTRGQYTQELILGGEYEVMPNLTVGANYIHRSLPSVIEDMSSDGGSNYLIGNPSANYDEEADKLEELAMDVLSGPAPNESLAALYRSRASQLRSVKNFDPPQRNYDALQVSAKTRATRNSLLLATYTYSRAVGNYPGLFSTETNQLDPNITSMYDLPDLMPNRYGPSGLDRPHNLKVDGFYQFDLKKAGLVVFGASVRAQSGIPGNTLAAHPIYGQRESYLLPRGAEYRSPASMTIDTHTSYGYQVNKDVRIEGYLEIFNLLNQQPELSIDDNYTTNSALPIVGGDRGDLDHAKSIVRGRQTASIVTRNLNYGKTATRQTPLTGQIGFRLTF
jgi:outer membrane receptor protein involved in Fe transport